MVQRTWSPGAGAAFAGSLAIVVVLVGSIAVFTGRAEEARDRPTYAQRLTLEAPALPAQRVPQLLDLWSQSGEAEGISLTGVTFYSRNKPLVTLCAGPEQACASTLGMAEVLRSEQVGGRTVTVGVIEPGLATGLGADLTHYWRTVPLFAPTSDPNSVPVWLDRQAP